MYVSFAFKQLYTSCNEFIYFQKFAFLHTLTKMLLAMFVIKQIYGK